MGLPLGRTPTNYPLEPVEDADWRNTHVEDTYHRSRWSGTHAETLRQPAFSRIWTGTQLRVPQQSPAKGPGYAWTLEVAVADCTYCTVCQ